MSDDFSARIYINGLPKVIEDCDLKEAFSGFGAVETAAVARFSKDGPSLGYGFVTFSSFDAAERARSAVDGQTIDCKYLTVKLGVQHCMDSWPRDNSERTSRAEKRKLFVSRFDDTLDSGALEGLFLKFGKVVSAQVVKDSFGRSRGFGFVTFETAQQAAQALSEMRQSKLPNQKSIFVEYAHYDKFSKRRRYGHSTRRFSTRKAVGKENWHPSA